MRNAHAFWLLNECMFWCFLPTRSAVGNASLASCWLDSIISSLHGCVSCNRGLPSTFSFKHKTIWTFFCAWKFPLQNTFRIRSWCWQGVCRFTSYDSRPVCIIILLVQISRRVADSHSELCTDRPTLHCTAREQNFPFHCTGCLETPPPTHTRGSKKQKHCFGTANCAPNQEAQKFFPLSWPSLGGDCFGPSLTFESCALGVKSF